MAVPADSVRVVSGFNDYSDWEPEAWPPGWELVRDREPLLREVRAEVAHGHELAGCNLAPVIKCAGCDSVVFWVEGQDLRFPRWALVHLTWTGQPEAPPWPQTKMFDAMRQVREHLEARHAH